MIELPRGMLTVALVCAAVLPAACEPYRVEYHTRPAFYRRVADGPLPDRVELEDGTVIVYRTRGEPITGDPGGEAKPFQLREETEDGSVVLHALLPEHVIANTLDCIRHHEYELLWDQVLSERTKLAYAEQGQGVEEFTAFFKKHRIDLARTLNRMLLGMASNEVVIEDTRGGVTVCRFWPQVATLFKFKYVALVREEFQYRLLLIY